MLTPGKSLTNIQKTDASLYQVPARIQLLSVPYRFGVTREDRRGDTCLTVAQNRQKRRSFMFFVKVFSFRQ